MTNITQMQCFGITINRDILQSCTITSFITLHLKTNIQTASVLPQSLHIARNVIFSGLICWGVVHLGCKPFVHTLALTAEESVEQHPEALQWQQFNTMGAISIYNSYGFASFFSTTKIGTDEVIQQDTGLESLTDLEHNATLNSSNCHYLYSSE
jgi:hypothetical protein